jgi:UPF0755 protein
MLRKHLETLKEKAFSMWGHRLFVVVACIVLLFVLIVLFYSAFFGPPSTDSLREDFVIAPGATLSEVTEELRNSGFAKSALALRIAYEAVRGEETLRPGGYTLSRDMDAFTLATRLAEAPRLVWVTIPAGTRKEEIAELFREELGWREETVRAWLTTDTELGDEYSEGVYYPDTYLIPSDQPPSEVAARLRGRFEEVFAPYAAEAAAAGKEWTDIVTLASLIEKEAGRRDKRLVSGILWNRLKKGMPLQVDATLQYIAATPEDWWPAPDPDDKRTDSPFNTYLYEGLPPRPIANPSLASIEAALSPQTTNCLYYLHDLYGRIHCSTNYRSHVANVNWYLR